MKSGTILLDSWYYHTRSFLHKIFDDKDNMWAHRDQHRPRNWVNHFQHLFSCSSYLLNDDELMKYYAADSKPDWNDL